MRTGISRTLRNILADTAREIELDKRDATIADLKEKIKDAPPIRSFAGALAPGAALIAELKQKSPSQGMMRPQNVQDAPKAYKESSAVKALSILTSWTNFGPNMRLTQLEKLKDQIGKPVLRKDFVIEEYQVYQARAYGADAILLMANLLEKEEMRSLSEKAFELGMDVLFETHCAAEVRELPPGAKILGINSRSFEGGLRPSNFLVARFFRRWFGAKRDFSTDPGRFSYAAALPDNFIKVAESGVSSQNCAAIFKQGFNAVLVGTSLLTDSRGVGAALRDFETALDTL
jgi:indole-3-glycerol phosphate synthase